MDKLDKAIDVLGLSFGSCGETIFLSKHRKDWYKFLNKYNIDEKYISKSNEETFCYLREMYFDAEIAFLEKIKNYERTNKN